MNTSATGISKYFNPTVAGACDVLQILSSRTKPISASEVAALTSLTRGTALRVMRTLAEIGIATDVGTAKYVAGPRLVAIGLQVGTNDTLSRIVEPFLTRLTDVTGETSHFAVLVGDKSLILAVCECSNALRVASRPGTEAWGHASDTGKAILSILPEEERTAICNRLRYEKLTSNTLDSPELLLDHLKQVAERGYAVDDEECFPGVRCLAAPVRLVPDDRPSIGAIGITSATIRFTRKRIREFAAAVCQTALDLDAELNPVRRTKA
jgi:IclR family acetate operon transcriptional repressor